MDIFDFITPDEIADLSDDDPRSAFADFTRVAQRSLNDATREVDGDSESGWRFIQDARHGFMNVVIAAAKRYQIEPFASLEVPRILDFNSDVHRQFRADLDHYLTQLLLDVGARQKKSSVLLAEDVKAAIRRHILEIRSAIDAADISDARRSALHASLSEFEKQLEKKRLNLMAVTLLTITLAGAPGSIAASGELLRDIWRAVAEAKVSEEEGRSMLAAPEPIALTPPRRSGIVKPHVSKNGPRESFSQDLDDEIPF